MAGLDSWTGWLGTVLDTPDPPGLAAFYAALLGGVPDLSDPTFVTLALPQGTCYLAFQLEPEHVPPTWPSVGSEQRMQSHLDIGVGDVAAAVREAERAGATLAAFQPQDDVRVLLDPAGHPFCLYLDRD